MIHESTLSAFVTGRLPRLRECVLTTPVCRWHRQAICETCGKKFHISHSHPRRFCSRFCYRMWVHPVRYTLYDTGGLEDLSHGVKTIPVDIPKFWKLLRASKYGTGTIAKAAKVHPDEVQKLIALGEGKFPLVRKLEAILGDFRL